MAFFYPPPPPSQSASYAPPVPHEPQGSTGDQPPRRQVQTALAMAMVLASWPASLEPRLQAPNNTRVTIAPLTFTYGDQPPIAGPITASEYAQVRLAWPTDWPAQTAPDGAPLQPPPILTFIPYRSPQANLVATWQDPLVIELVTQYTIAPDNPDQPPRRPPLTVNDLNVQRSWPTDWKAQTGPKMAAWFVPPPSNPPPPHSAATTTQLLIGQAWPREWGLPQRLTQIADLTQQRTGIPICDGFNTNFSISLGPNWTNAIGHMGTDGFGHADPIDAGQNLVFWNASSFAADQSSTITIAAYNDDGPGPCVRISPSGDASYAMVAIPSTNSIVLYQTVASVGTAIQTVLGITFAPNDVMRLEVTGPVLRMFFNGAQIGTDQTDTGVTTGQPGFFVNHLGVEALIDLWCADNITPLLKPTKQDYLWTSWQPDTVEVVTTSVIVQENQPVISQPPVVGPINLETLTSLQAWPRDWSEPQRLTTLVQAATGTPPVPSAFLSVTETAIIGSQWAQTWPTQRARNITATLPVGTPPQPIAPLSAANQAAIFSQWQPNWAAQAVKPVRDIEGIGGLFKAEWAANSNQIVGPWAPQPETH